MGFYLNSATYVDNEGGIWMPPQDGLGAINWEKVGEYFSPFVAAGAGWLASKGMKNQPPQYYDGPGQPGVYAGASSQGLFGGIDTTTLLIMGAVALLFFSQPARK